MKAIIADAKTGIARPIDDLERFPDYAPHIEPPALDIEQYIIFQNDTLRRLDALEASK